MLPIQCDRLRSLAETIRSSTRPAAIAAADFCALVAESGTQDAGLVKAASKLARCQRPVFVEAQTLVTLIDSLQAGPVAAATAAASDAWAPPAVQDS